MFIEWAEWEMCGDVEVDEEEDEDDEDDDDNVYEESDDVDKLEELFSDGMDGTFLSPKQNVHTVIFVDLSINLFVLDYNLF